VQKGNSEILELPISAILYPYIGTTMRICPAVTRIVQKFLFYESQKTEKPIVFVFHPNECIEPGATITRTRRSKNPISYVFGDIIKQRLKLKNMGKRAIQLLDKILNDAREYGFEFIDVKRYRKMYS
jgi:hypothetical protein